jgi:hypothetical protein
MRAGALTLGRSLVAAGPRRASREAQADLAESCRGRLAGQELLAKSCCQRFRLAESCQPSVEYPTLLR